MRTEILCRPAGTVAELRLDADETVCCEVGAMVAMSPGFTVSTSAGKRGGDGSFLKGLKRAFAGENFFLNHFTATAPEQRLIIGPGLLGDIIEHSLTGGTLIVQGSSWLASGPGIEIDATWQGFGNALFSGESIFWVRCSGSGPVLLNSFGAIHRIEVDGEHIVDTGHIVGFEDTLQFRVTKSADSWLASFLGGEGLVCRFSGRGVVYCQSHNPPSFGKLVGRRLKPR
jgi:uncharacterized protein (TIGR00266 family)